MAALGRFSFLLRFLLAFSAIPLTLSRLRRGADAKMVGDFGDGESLGIGLLYHKILVAGSFFRRRRTS